MCTCLYMCHIYICVRVGVCFVCVCAGGEAIWGHQRTLSIILSAIFYWDKVSVNPELTISAKLVAAIPSSSPVFALTVVGLPRACSSSWITVWVLIQTQAVLLWQQGLQLTEPSSYSLDLLSLEELQHLPCSWEFASPPGTPQNIWDKWTQGIYLYVKPQAENMIKREFKKNLLYVRIYKM